MGAAGGAERWCERRTVIGEKRLVIGEKGGVGNIGAKRSTDFSLGVGRILEPVSL
jgi:hypothetical protein